MWRTTLATVKRFQSTLPVWGATRNGSRRLRAVRYFNPRSPCGERPDTGRHTGATSRFQSTLPVWGATDYWAQAAHGDYISIHAPRVGSDVSVTAVLPRPMSFQSTLPVWGATIRRAGLIILRAFQSTLPVWGATTANRRQSRPHPYFNPRSPCGERLRWST